MLMKTISQTMMCAVLLTAILAPAQIQAEDPAAAVTRLQQELNTTKKELALSQAKVAEQSAQITKMEASLKTKGGTPGDATGLADELKKSKSKISELEEQIFVITDGKGVKGQEVAEVFPEGTYEWTENMRRQPIGVLFPKTATIPEGDFFARFSHTSMNQQFVNGGKGHAFHDMLGLESGVKVGILFGYGITKDWDLTVQRTNGRDYVKNGVNYEAGSFDLWDVMTKYQLLHEDDQFVDLSLSAGITYFCQDDWSGQVSGNGALLVEKSLWRFRFGSGLLYSSLSMYESARSSQSDVARDKRYPKEYRGLWEPVDENHTLAVPVSLSFALTGRHQLFSEMAIPISGYHTENDWPSLAAGWRYNTPTHAYSLYFSNTANGSFNSNFTGGYKAERLDLFGFDISIYF